ncbi:MAG: hypothetical protein LBI95_03685 [Holosporales bacterium]|nr:hypothetical protein [Holosporales bacterium]
MLCLSPAEWFKVLNQLFHVEHFMFKVSRLIQALIGKDEESAYIYPA